MKKFPDKCWPDNINDVDLSNKSVVICMALTGQEPAFKFILQRMIWQDDIKIWQIVAEICHNTYWLLISIVIIPSVNRDMINKFFTCYILKKETENVLMYILPDPLQNNTILNLIVHFVIACCTCIVQFRYIANIQVLISI